MDPLYSRADKITEEAAEIKQRMRMVRIAPRVTAFALHSGHT
jgi:hypothetical protein